MVVAGPGRASVRRAYLSWALNNTSLATKEQAWRKATWKEGIVRPLLWGQKNLAHSGIGKKVGVAWAEWAKRRVGETYPTTGHLKVLPSDSHSATETYGLQQIWTLSHGSMFCFCFTFFLQVKNMKQKDQRLKIMNEILNGIKVSSRL